MHFSLVKLQPLFSSGPNGFDDAMFPLYFGLKSLGFQVEILFNTINFHSQNIIFGTCNSPEIVGREIPPDSIIFNLEQMFPGSRWDTKKYLKHLHQFTVWDYSMANIEYLQSKNISATYVPLGYAPEMSRITRLENPQIDTLFYGGLTSRREEIIKRLNNAGIQAFACNYLFGKERDLFLANTKSVINMHIELPARLEIVRLGYAWANKIPVISERNNNTVVPEYLEEACFYAPYEDLEEETKRVIHDEKRLLQQADIGFKAFSSRTMKETLRSLIGERKNVAKPASTSTSVKTVSNKEESASSDTSCFEWFISGNMTP